MASEGHDEGEKTLSASSDCHAKMAEALRLLQEDNPEGAVALVRQCAEEHDARGLWALGLCFEYGIGVDKDMEHAMQLYSESARQKNHVGSRFEKELRKNGGESQSLEMNGEKIRVTHLFFVCNI